jgi:hypothetical protein
MPLLDQCRGLGRSLFTYYGDPFAVRREARFYADFIRPGDLSFDIGAWAPWLAPSWASNRAPSAACSARAEG